MNPRVLLLLLLLLLLVLLMDIPDVQTKDTALVVDSNAPHLVVAFRIPFTHMS